ncbi:MAG TPA: ATP synthase F1 subunit epsilon [Gemmatimonadales bacterium]|jgi:F-type H+-transporting ATPase subunit epsilon
MSGTPVDHAASGHMHLDAPHGALAEHPHGGTLTVQVVSPEAILFDGTAASLTVPAYDGLIGILPRHAPMLALLGRGILRVKAAGGERRFKVGGGFVQVRANVVRVVAEEAATG